MEEIIIKKLSIDKYSFFDIDGILDIQKRTINLNIPFTEFESIFKFKPGELFLNPDKINKFKTIYVCDDKNNKYSCLNCIFGFKYNEPINIYSAPIDLIIENKISETENIHIDKLVFTTSFPKKYSLYINNFSFKYTKSKQISTKKYVENDKVFIDYTIVVSKSTEYDKLSSILYSLIELTFLFLGDIPKIEKIKMYNNDDEFILYSESAPKYMQRKNIFRSSNNGILAYFDSNIISPSLLKTFIKFRNQTKILFDMLMINMNGDGYIEITNSMLVQLLEGLYKTINQINKKELRDILDFYYLKNPTINSLLEKRDLKDAGDSLHTPIFLLKAKEQRHYLSHLNMNQQKKVFYQLENNYAYWKLNLAIRIYIMQNLDVTINQEEFDKMKASIERWAKDHHLRYKK